MVTKLNTYEGVPIGGNNFEDFLSYMRDYLSANFAFSTGASGNNGGYFLPDDFEYTKKTTSGVGNSAYFIGPSTKDSGSLFGTKDGSFYRFEVLNNTVNDPQVYVWTLLASETSTNINSELRYRNDYGAERMVLPYRPITKNQSNQFVEGYREVRFNGIPQEDYTLSFNTTSNFRTQELAFDSLRLAPELPKPVVGESYTDAISLSNLITKDDLISDFNSRLTFEFTNFSIEGGGHIILYKPATRTMVYVPRDTSVGTSVASGTYKVIDYARGIIELNPSNAQLEQLRVTGEIGEPDVAVHFTVLSAEQLLEETVNNITRYRTRYGAIYDGDVSNAMLVEYLFDGTSHTLREIPNSEYIGTPGSILLSDVNGNYTDGLVLALFYNGTIDQTELVNSQTVRYIPDTFQLYFHAGIVATTASDGDDIRAIVATNPSSWFNQNVTNLDYYPVNRTEEAYYFLIDVSETANFPDNFDPAESFEIVDTIGISNLNDVTSVDNGDVLVYDAGSSTWVGTPFSLASLLDTNVSTISNNWVLQWDTGTSRWVARSVTDMLTRSGFTSVLSYSTAHAIPAADTAIPHRKFVVDTINSSISTHNSDTTTAHGATNTPTANRIARWDASARMKSSLSTGQLAVGSSDNAAVISPSTAANDTVTLQWILNNSTVGVTTPGASPHRLLRRNGQGYTFVPTPISRGHIANRGYVEDYVDDLFSWARSYASESNQQTGYIRIGSLLLAWGSQTAGGGSNNGGTSPGQSVKFYGPTLPSGTRKVLTSFAAPKTNQSNQVVKFAYVQNSSKPSGLDIGIESNKPYAVIRGDGDNNGEAWNMHVFWIVRYDP